MNTIISVSVIVVAVAILIAVGFMVAALIQVRRTARQAEIFLLHIKDDFNALGNIVSNISFFTQKLSSPWIKFGAMASSFAAMFFSRHKK